MNYLAHLYLAGDDDAEISGALLGDFVKGPLDTIALPASVVEGIRLHRQVDSYTDDHPLVAQSRARLNERGLVAGIIVDVVYDHFLVNHWNAFAQESLEDFTQYRYERLLARLAQYPPSLQRMVPMMSQHDWLTSYGDIDTVGLALERIGTRLSRPGLLDGSQADVEKHYQGLEQDFLRFFPEVVANFARNKRR